MNSLTTTATLRACRTSKPAFGSMQKDDARSVHADDAPRKGVVDPYPRAAGSGRTFPTGAQP
jgi:hypothetical protein